MTKILQKRADYLCKKRIHRVFFAVIYIDRKISIFLQLF